jgi:NADPH2:quinone reductase
VVGAAWGSHVLAHPERSAAIAGAVAELIEAGYVRPIVGARYPLERASEALLALEKRQATGKVVLELK